MCRVVHLDLKSCNVLIGGDGTAKISDVGLALLIRGQYLSSTAPAGTFSWVAPEVILGGTPPAILDSPHFPCILSDHIPPIMQAGAALPAGFLSCSLRRLRPQVRAVRLHP